MKKVLILGATGMLGSGVYSVLKDKYSLVLTVRKKEEAALLDKAYGGLENHQVVEFDAEHLYNDFVNKRGDDSPYFNSLLNQIGEVDYVINAIGVIIPYALDNPTLTFFINSAFPYILARYFGPRLIHITTDCVFNGKEGFPYTEKSPKNPVDIYGLSKALGEPIECLTLRTSIIGHEIKGFKGLLEWFLQQEGKSVKGFANHFWNGITTREFGRVCDKIISGEVKHPGGGIYHIFSESLSKYEMLLKFKEKYKINCDITADNPEGSVNRTLSTIYPLNKELQIRSFDEMLEDLYQNRPVLA